MVFLPCIDIHNGKVKQIVGSTLGGKDPARENFVSDKDASYYAGLYREYGLYGGHVINLNASSDEFYEDSKKQVLSALAAFPGGLMAGGGINADNAKQYIDAGASHVIVTSFVFSGGRINDVNLEKLEKAVGRDHIVLDLSCKKTGGKYMVATDRWQKISDEEVCPKLFERLSGHCDEFLVHAVDAEGKKAGIDRQLVELLAASGKRICYAGGVSCYEDIRILKKAGEGRVDFTVGSRLDIFGGDMSIKEIIECTR